MSITRSLIDEAGAPAKSQPESFLSQNLELELRPASELNIAESRQDDHSFDSVSIKTGFVESKLEKFPWYQKICSNPLLLHWLQFALGIILMIICIASMHNNLFSKWINSEDDKCYWLSSEEQWDGCVDGAGVYLFVLHIFCLPCSICCLAIGISGIINYNYNQYQTSRCNYQAKLSLILFVIIFTLALIVLFVWDVYIFFIWDTEMTPMFPRILVGLALFAILATFSLILLILFIQFYFRCNICNCCIKNSNNNNLHKRFRYINIISNNYDNFSVNNWCQQWCIKSFLLIVVYFGGWWMICTLVPPLWHAHPGNWYPSELKDWVQREAEQDWTVNYLLMRYSVSISSNVSTNATDVNVTDVSSNYSLELDLWFLDENLDDIDSGGEESWKWSDTGFDTAGGGELGPHPNGGGSGGNGKTSKGADNGGDEGAVWMKLYPDIFLYYGWFVSILIVALLSKCFEKVNRTLSKRLWLFQTTMFKKCGVGLYAIYPTVGDVIFVTWFCAVFTFWFYYWHFKHAFHLEAEKNVIEIQARAFGMDASLFAALSFIPMTRYSWFNQILGISFENVIGYHIYLGYLFVLCSVLHVILWLAYFNNNNGYDLISNLIFSEIPLQYVQNNPAVPLMWYVYVFAIFPSIAVASFPLIRRKCFEYFYNIHLIGAFITVTGVLWHANSSLFWLLPTVGLYFVDRIIRFFNGMQKIEVVKFTPLCKDIVSLQFRMHIPNVSSYKPGSFVFIKINEISSIQWHPFSLFSCDLVQNDNNNGFYQEISVLIKRSGDFTSKLWNLAIETESQSSDTENIEKKMNIAVDGPYGGISFDYQLFGHIIFVAGGIGITPIYSIISYLLNLRDDAGLQGNIPNITLFWMVRDIELLHTCVELYDFNNNDNKLDGIKLNLNLFLTKMEECSNDLIQAMTQKYNVAIGKNRPVLKELFVNMFGSDEDVGASEDTLLFCCGPHSMVQDCRNISFSRGFNFHSETFEF